MTGAWLSMSVVRPIVVLFVVFLYFGFRLPFALFYHNVFDCMCFTVIFHRWGRGSLNVPNMGHGATSELKRSSASKTGPWTFFLPFFSYPLVFQLAVSRRFLFCKSSLCVCGLKCVLSLFVPHHPCFGTLDRLCFVIVAFPGYLYLYVFKL